ncbi:hypothetical protein KUTeg_014032 [Tegillarca granosa]|uniref:Globin domain-containing protein n=1 Tax=Tegillarca granosa TaxID=220873 RepID=A0ABQ9EVG2_TEGGR|nr:hypothetical protein KUTeg_014032 [Tegillarca granosa]
MPPTHASALVPPIHDLALFPLIHASALVPLIHDSALVPPIQGSILVPLIHTSALVPPIHCSTLLQPIHASALVPPIHDSAQVPDFLKTLESDVLKLFSKIITTEDNGNTLGVDHEMLQRHAMLVMQGIGTAVELLEDLDELNSFLKVLGEKHNKLRVKPYMLERLWPAIDYSFRGVLSDVYENELRNAWKTFFDYMVYKMRESMFNTRKSLSEDKNDTLSMFTPRMDRNECPNYLMKY